MNSAPRTLPELAAGLASRGSRRAVGLAGDLGVRWWSYERLAAEIGRASGRLAERGVGPRDRVVLRAPNGPEWVAAFLALTVRGAVPVLVDDRQPAELVERIAQREGAKLVLDDGALADLFPPEPASPAGSSPAAPVRPADPAVIVYSSGTTSEPKGVVLSHANLMAQLAPFARWRGLVAVTRGRFLVLPPLAHVLGLVVGLAVPLWMGLAAVYTRSLHPAQWARTIRDAKIAVLVAVPRTLELLADLLLSTPDRRGVPLRERMARSGPRRARLLVFWQRGELFGRIPFRAIFVGGAALPEALESFWRRSGLLVVPGYGLTETAAFVSIRGPFARRSGGLGRPLAGQELRLAPDGEILVRGPNLGRGGALEMTEDGFLRTGDLGRIDERGALRFSGRKKEIIVTPDGLKVVPDDVEKSLLREPGLREAVVVPRPVPGGEEVHAVLVPEPGTGASQASAASNIAEIVARANRSLQPSQRITGWTVWPEPELPRTALGKVVRREIAARLAEPSPPLPRTGAPVRLRQILEAADRRERIDLLARYLGQEEPDPDEPPGLTLVDGLGLGSLDVVELLGRLEAPLPVGEACTVAELRAGRAGRAGTFPSAASAAPRLPVAQPRWAGWPPAALWRGLMRRIVLGAWSGAGFRIVARWETDPERLPWPLLIVAAPHRHWLDGFVIALALPPRLRGRLLVVTNRELQPLSLAYWLLLPSLFPFTVLPPFGRTREGLIETARKVAQGFGPITFPEGLRYYGMTERDRTRHDPGTAWLALETGAPLLPAVLVDNEEIGWQWHRPRRTVEVRFGAPLWPRPGEAPDDLAERSRRALDALGREVEEEEKD